MYKFSKLNVFVKNYRFRGASCMLKRTLTSRRAGLRYWLLPEGRLNENNLLNYREMMSIAFQSLFQRWNTPSGGKRTGEF